MGYQFAAFKMKFIEKLKFNDDGLVPAIVQEEGTGRVVMMAWMNDASLKSTILRASSGHDSTQTAHPVQSIVARLIE